MVARFLPQDAKQPGIGTVGVIGTATAVLFIVAIWAVPSTAQRSLVEERPAPEATTLLDALAVAAAPIPHKPEAVTPPVARKTRVVRTPRVYTWRAWLENPAWDRTAFEAAVSRILADPRGWGATGEIVFRHISTGRPRIWVKLATPPTTDRLCAPTRTNGIWNCRAGNSVVVNSDRWLTGRSTWPGSLTEYRALIINHETGHVLGFGHRGCSGAGTPAPVMQQQGVSLKGCRANAWPLASELARL